MIITADTINFLCLDITELAQKRLKLDEIQTDELYDKLLVVLNEFCGSPDYSNYNQPVEYFTGGRTLYYLYGDNGHGEHDIITTIKDKIIELDLSRVP